MHHAVRRLLLLLVLAPALAFGQASPASAQPTQSIQVGVIGLPELPGPLTIPGLPLLSPTGSNDFNCRPTSLATLGR